MNRTANSPGFNKQASSLLCLSAYCAAILAAGATIYLIDNDNVMIAAFCADCVATLIVFCFSRGLNNSSIYDPYWSLAPLPVALYWAAGGGAGDGLHLRQIIVIALVVLWGGRLTYNWHRQWKGLAHEDWRYVDLRGRTGRWYWPVSFWGIHFFPTAIVFLGCLSLYPVMNSARGDIGALDIAGIIIAGGGISIEAAADRQLHRFIKSDPSKNEILSTGLWAYSRHPNYFGEVSFWWGLFIFSIAADKFYWWSAVGPVALTVMFLTISIPMMERHMLSRRPRYAERRRAVSAFIPWFPKKPVEVHPSKKL